MTIGEENDVSAFSKLKSLKQFLDL